MSEFTLVYSNKVKGAVLHYNNMVMGLYTYYNNIIGEMAGFTYYIIKGKRALIHIGAEYTLYYNKGFTLLNDNVNVFLGSEKLISIKNNY